MIQPLLCATILLLALSVTACSTGPQPQDRFEDYPEAVFTPKRLLPSDHADTIPVYDPWESMNKRIYNFNYHFDKAVFVPIAKGYKAVVPQFARTGITNFFENIYDISTMFNSILQLSPTKFAQSTGRVLVNSTVGLLGLIDVASEMKIPRPDEDFGQTLGYWGVGQGPYLVLPFLGPSNLRDGFGKLPDFYVRGLATDAVITSDSANLALDALWAVDLRANTDFRYYENGFAFEYRMVRLMWSTKRKLDVDN